MRTRIKICGITDIEGAEAAVEAGADALGLVFYPESPRYVRTDEAAKIARAVPPFVTVVGLFVDPVVAAVERVLADCRLDLLQFHGQESPALCGGFGKPYLKAVRMAPGIQVLDLARQYDQAAGLLLDAYVPGVAGGTGQIFDWASVPPLVGRTVVLAGGLNAVNVGRAIRQVRPYAVDVSGGVEHSKGRKDPVKMRAFVAAVRNADDTPS